MKKGTSVKELNAVLVGSRSSLKYLVGNTILGKQEFQPKDEKSHCETREGEVYGRRVTLVKAPGWLRGYRLHDTSELFKTEAILSVSLCPSALHCFILVINAEQPFQKVHKKATKEHLQQFFGDKVWDHTIVVLSHTGQLGHRTTEDYIKSEGAPLQSLLEACGNRYHVICDDGADNNVKVKQLFEKIDAMVAENSCYEINSSLMQSAESKRKEVDKNAEELHLQSQQQRKKIRNLLTEPTPNLRILMVGWVFSGKSATGNTILSADVFQSGDRTVKAIKKSGEVAGREVLIVDTPGWWKFFPARFNPLFLKPEILKGVSLCSPSPNVILLTVPADTAFTDEQKRILEDCMKLLGPGAWRHVIVLFTFGDTLGCKTIEQHIESEGKPLLWLIDKCENRYHVLNNTSAADDQVTELLEKMEEMVAGNSSFFLSETDDPQLEEDRRKKDENTTNKITEQLNIEWDRKNWERHQICKGKDSMDEPPTMSGDKQESDASEGEEEQMEHRHEDEELTGLDLEVTSEDDAASGSLKMCMGLLEREWSRREAAMEQASWTHSYNPVGAAPSEPDSDSELLKSREKVTLWLKKSTSGYGSASTTNWTPEEENKNEKGEISSCLGDH